MHEIKTLPKWILIVSSFFTVLGLLVSFSLCFYPQAVLKTVDLTAKGVPYLIYMWAARQFTIGFIFGFAVFKKSPPMLTLAYIFFLVMNILDALVGIAISDSSLIIGTSIMCIISSAMLYVINKPK